MYEFFKIGLLNQKYLISGK